MFHVSLPSSPRPAMPPPMHRLLVRAAWPRRSQTPGGSPASPAPPYAADPRRPLRRQAPSHLSARSEAGRRRSNAAARSDSGSREVLRRALSPPVQRRRGQPPVKRRWWNFRPTPSRLSNMSMASAEEEGEEEET